MIAAATLVAAALRLFRLGHQSLWIDEIFSWYSAGMGGPLAVRDLLENVHGPLYSLLLHACMRAGGDAEWVLRAPSALAGILTVPAFAWLAARWLGRESAGIAAWVAAGSPFLVWYSQEARNYSLLVLLVCVSAAALLELQRRCDVPRVARYLLLAGAALLSNLSFALLAPLHLRWWLAGDAATRTARVRALLAVTALLVLLAAPWFGSIARTWDWRRLQPDREAVAGETALRGATTFHAAAVPFALHAFAVGYTLGPSLRELRAHAGAATLKRHAPELLAAGTVFGALAVAGIVALARRKRLADTLLWLVAPGLVVSYFAAQNFKVFHPRYLAVSLPCVLLVLVAAFTDLPSRWRRIGMAAVAALWAMSLYQHYFVADYAREDYRGALAVVRGRIAPGEQVLAMGSEDPVRFYARGLTVDRLWLGHVDQPGVMPEKFAAKLSQAGGTWVVLSREEDLDPADRFARWLEQTYPRAGRWKRPGVRVWHLTGSDVAAAAPAAPAVP
ncbi:MAG: glycosyltransferase family 39 protein [Candidatus Eisenbacteria bacterium]